MEPVARIRADKRLMCFGALLALWAVLILAQLFRLQVIRHAGYVKAAHQQQEEKIEIPAPRGSIFDRYGQLLAGSVKRDSVYIDPVQVPDVKVASDILGGVLGMDKKALQDRMRMYVQNEKGFMWVTHGVEPDQYERLRSLHLDWIRFEDESRRSYPRNDLAAHVVGSVDSREVGQWGLEMSLESDLQGLPGTMRVLTDAKKHGIESEVETEPRPGTNVTISIDERIQLPAQDAIAQAVLEAHAESGSVVVMDPYHGDVLALASYPAFDPNQNPAHGDNAQERINRAVSAPFEPGSVFKVFTISAALETTDITPHTIIDCGNGTLKMAGRVVHEAHHGYGSIPVETVLAKSSNIGAIKIGLRVGAEHFREYLHRFGLGLRTGVPLPWESGGRIAKGKWSQSTLMSASMGHEVGVTTLQLAQACSAVANGGLFVPARLILKKGAQAIPLATPHRILKPETAITMRQMMEGVVLNGTGKKAKLNGYSTAGKTGSAQIYDHRTGHYTHSYNASFMGFAPVTNPAIVVVVTLNGTHGTEGFGGAAAAPVFKVIAAEALRVLDVPRDVPDNTPDKADKSLDVADAAILDGPTEPPVLEEVDAQQPPVKPSVAYGPQLPPAEPAQEASGPKAPNLIGMSKRSVVALAQAQGLPLLMEGTGIVRRQVPPPGAALRGGERIRVDLAR